MDKTLKDNKLMGFLIGLGFTKYNTEEISKTIEEILDDFDSDNEDSNCELIFNYIPGEIIPVLIQKYGSNKRKVSAERRIAYEKIKKEGEDYNYRILEDSIKFSNKHASVELIFFPISEVKKIILKCDNLELEERISAELDLSKDMFANLNIIYKKLLEYKPNNL